MRQIYVTLLGGGAIVVFVVLKIRGKYVLYVYRSIGVWGSGLGLFIGNRRLSRKFPIKRERRKLGNPCVCVEEQTRKGKEGRKWLMKKEVMCSFPPISLPLFHHLHFLLFFFLIKEEEGKTNRKKERERRRRKLLEKIWRGGKNGGGRKEGRGRENAFGKH